MRNQFGEFVPGMVTETELRASVQPMSLKDADFAGGVQVSHRLSVHVPEPDALSAAFEDDAADRVVVGGLAYAVEESQSWRGSQTRAILLRRNLMRWPWQKREKRESGGDFSDAVVRLIEAQAAGTARRMLRALRRLSRPRPVRCRVRLPARR